MRVGSQFAQQSCPKSHFRLTSRRLQSQLSAVWFGSWYSTANWCRHTCRFLPALQRLCRRSMIAVWSVSCAAVSPADNTASSVWVKKQDFNWLVLYAGHRAASKGFVDCREIEKDIPSLFPYRKSVAFGFDVERWWRSVWFESSLLNNGNGRWCCCCCCRC